MQTVIVTGGTGLVGRRLCRMLVEKGMQVVILTRTIPAAPAPAGMRFAKWDVKKGEIDASVLKEADAIIHLAGAGVVERRWSAAYKNEILESRTQSSALLLKVLREHPNKVRTLVSASAIGWYGPDQPGGQPFTEDAPAYHDFLGNTCAQWEASVDAAGAIGVRVVKLRTGIVLSPEGGALAEFRKPLRLGVAAILGNGQQVVSWIHIDDLCRMFIQSLEQPGWSGAYNAVAPAPVTNKMLTLELAEILRGRFFIPVYVPAFLLKWIMGESSIEVLKSCTVSAGKVKQQGFNFLYPSIRSALEAFGGK